MEFLAGSGHGIELRKAVNEIPPKMTHILACNQPFMFLYQPVAWAITSVRFNTFRSCSSYECDVLFPFQPASSGEKKENKKKNSQ